MVCGCVAAEVVEGICFVRCASSFATRHLYLLADIVLRLVHAEACFMPCGISCQQKDCSAEATAVMVILVDSQRLP